MVKPTHVVEIESTDIINSTSEGLIKKYILNFRDKYSIDQKTNSVSLTTPVFTRFREDKKINTNDVGINQIDRVIEIPSEVQEDLVKKNSKIISKEIYLKEAKGLKMVRKYLCWSTNAESTDYPKYVFCKIDYSPSRATKMKREIKVSNDKNQILDIFSYEIEKDIKKGWNKI